MKLEVHLVIARFRFLYRFLEIIIYSVFLMLSFSPKWCLESSQDSFTCSKLASANSCLGSGRKHLSSLWLLYVPHGVVQVGDEEQWRQDTALPYSGRSGRSDDGAHLVYIGASEGSKQGKMDSCASNG